MRRPALWLLLALSTLGCDPQADDDGEVVDLPTADARAIDGGAPEPLDAESLDAAPPDAAPLDAALPDAAQFDAAQPDADPCTPDCADRTCGDDGCGGRCGACDPDERCGDDGTCTPDAPRPGGGCDQPYALFLEPHETQGSIEGTLTDHGFDNSCSDPERSGIDAAVTFEAPSRGVWGFTTVGTGIDTVLQGRSICSQPLLEIFCNDDFDGGRFGESAVVARLLAGERITIIVDTDNYFGAGPFVLTALRVAAPPRIDNLTATYNPATSSIGITIDGRDPDDDVTHVELAATGEFMLPVRALPEYEAVVERRFDDPAFALDFVQGEGRYRGRGVLTVADNPSRPTHLTVTVFDDTPYSETVQVELVEPAVLALGADCVIDDAFTRCPDASNCRVVDDQPPRCVVESTPEITTLSVFKHPRSGNIGVHVEGLDHEEDVDKLTLTLLDAAGEVVPVYAHDPTPRRAYDDRRADPGRFAGRFIAEADVPPELAWADAVRARVVVHDIGGHDSAPVEVDITPPPVGVEDGPCDTALAFDDCPRLTRCRRVGARGLCLQDETPRLYDGRAALTPGDEGAHAFGLVLRGDDRDDDITGVELQLLDAEGEPMADVMPPAPVVFAPVELFEVDFVTYVHATGTLTPLDRCREHPIDTYDDCLADPDGRVLAATSVRVWLLDRTGRLSDPLVLPLERAPVLDHRAHCDDDGLLGTCGPDLECSRVEGNFRLTTCQYPGFDCPRDWLITRLDDRPVDDALRWETAGGANDGFVIGGTCGGGELGDVFPFTAPVDGTYVFRITEADFDPILYVRTRCVAEGFEHELACNDDYDVRLSALEIELGAGDEVFVFVDQAAERGGWRSYTLEAYVGELPPR